MSTKTVKNPTVADLVAAHESTAGAKRKSLRDSWSRLAMDAVMNGDDDTAKLYAEAVKTASETTTTRSSAVEVDWRQITANRIDSLRRAADLIESGDVRPAGTPDDIDLDNLPEPDDSTRDASIALATTRLAGTRNVPTFIAERVAELGDGWHTASDLARGQVDAPSTGAIGAVYAKMARDGFAVEGIVAGRNEKGSQAFGPA